MLTVGGRQVARFRLARHRLAWRSPDGDLLAAAGSVGVQHTPPGSAGQALHARLYGLSPGDVADALRVDKTLVQLWSVRGAPHVVPTEDAAVFTTGLLPDDEESCRHFIRGAAGHLARFEMTASAAVEHTVRALPRVLDGRELTKDELGVSLADEVASSVPGRLRRAWNEPDGLGKNTYGQSLVRFALYVAGLQGTVCFVPGVSGAARFALTEQWLGRPLPALSSAFARAELVRRYVGGYGPTDADEFAAWSGVSPGYARRSWDLIADELAEVRYGDRRAWILRTGLDLLHDPPRPAGVRLLPPHDPYLATPDRVSLVADRTLRRAIWRSIGNPGVVLSDGVVAGVWRPRKQGGRLAVRIEPVVALSPSVRDAIEEEAASVAPFRGARTASIEVTAR